MCLFAAARTLVVFIHHGVLAEMQPHLLFQLEVLLAKMTKIVAMLFVAGMAGELAFGETEAFRRIGLRIAEEMEPAAAEFTPHLARVVVLGARTTYLAILVRGEERHDEGSEEVFPSVPGFLSEVDHLAPFDGVSAVSAMFCYVSAMV